MSAAREAPEEASYLQGLNPQQREAVRAPPGPTLVFAGAGSGKTRVIVHRILHLLAEGTPPGAILALTFTNKAAGEMRERLAATLGPGGRGVWLGTFHATGARILRREYGHMGLPRDFVVMSRGECLTILKREMKAADISTERYPPRSVLERIGKFKIGGEIPEIDAFPHSVEAVAARMAPRYEKTLRAGGGLDFDDLLALPLKLFRDHPGVLEEYRDRFTEILVDEFQDTNAVQNQLVILLAGKRQRVFAVGDDDQSIYRWRGAEVENIRRFEREFQGARVFQLEENYRSSANILAAAAAVMKRARDRREKRLFTKNAPGESVVYFSAADPSVEAQMVCQRIVKAGAGETIPWSEVAVFYRTNTQSRPFEEEARRRRIPYQVVKGQRFFDRTEVQDLAAYLRVVNRADDAPAFTRIINRPTRGLGPSKLLAIQNETGEAGEAGENGLITMETARSALESGRVTGAAARSLDRLILGLEELSTRRLGPVLMLEAVIEGTGYRKWLRGISADTASPERRRAAERGLEGVEEFIAAAQAFEERVREEEGMKPEDPEAMTRFLEDLALASEVDDMDDEAGKLSLMTLHAAKGLEFQVVAVVGVQDGLIPHIRSMDEPESLEEERRLLYVGMTRAKDRLLMSWARERRPEGNGGSWESCPSRFLEMIPDDLLIREDSAAERTRPRFREDSPGIFSEPPRSKGEQKVSIVSDEALGPFAPGARVVHPKFGSGVISARSGAGERTIVTVDFEQVGSKKLVLHHAPLQPAEGAVDGGETPAV